MGTICKKASSNGKEIKIKNGDFSHFLGAYRISGFFFYFHRHLIGI